MRRLDLWLGRCWPSFRFDWCVLVEGHMVLFFSWQLIKGKVAWQGSLPSQEASLRVRVDWAIHSLTPWGHVTLLVHTSVVATSLWVGSTRPLEVPVFPPLEYYLSTVVSCVAARDSVRPCRASREDK